jgi:hypothetical protein
MSDAHVGFMIDSTLNTEQVKGEKSKRHKKERTPLVVGESKKRRHDDRMISNTNANNSTRFHEKKPSIQSSRS